MYCKLDRKQNKWQHLFTNSEVFFKKSLSELQLDFKMQVFSFEN
jgi:hypothetical protein